MAATSLDGTIIMGAGQSGLALDYGVTLMAVRAAEGVFKVETTHGTKTALSVVGATGANAVPYVPAPAARLAPGPKQLHGPGYRNPGSVSDGGGPAFPGHPAPRVRTVVWATGYRPDFSWIGGLPVDAHGWGRLSVLRAGHGIPPLPPRACLFNAGDRR